MAQKKGLAEENWHGSQEVEREKAGAKEKNKYIFPGHAPSDPPLLTGPHFLTTYSTMNLSKNEMTDEYSTPSSNHHPQSPTFEHMKLLEEYSKSKP